MRTLLLSLLTLSLPALADLPAPKPAETPAETPTKPEASSSDAAASPLSPEQEVAKLLKERKLKSYEAAYEKASALLKKDPKSVDRKLDVVRALNGIMRIKTTGNLVLLDGTSDNSRNKKTWAKYGPEADKLAKEVMDARPKSVEARLMYTEAYMFHSSSFGILKAFFGGAAGKFEDNGNWLIKHGQTADDAVGYIYLGSLYLVAPWPVGNSKKAKENYELAVKHAPKSVRNHYYLGVWAYRNKDKELAKKELSFAANNKCTNTTEREFCWKIKEQAKKGLELLEK
jgi:hypothetical protein